MEKNMFHFNFKKTCLVELEIRIKALLSKEKA